MMSKGDIKQQDMILPRTVFCSVAWEWLDYKEKDLKSSSYTRYSGILTTYLLPEFGSREIYRIDRKEVEAFSRKLLTKGRDGENGLSAVTVNGILSVLRAVFTYYNYMYEPVCADLSRVRIKQPTKTLRVFSQRAGPIDPVSS